MLPKTQVRAARDKLRNEGFNESQRVANFFNILRALAAVTIGPEDVLARPDVAAAADGRVPAAAAATCAHPQNFWTRATRPTSWFLLVDAPLEPTMAG